MEDKGSNSLKAENILNTSNQSKPDSKPIKPFGMFSKREGRTAIDPAQGIEKELNSLLEQQEQFDRFKNDAITQLKSYSGSSVFGPLFKLTPKYRFATALWVELAACPRKDNEFFYLFVGRCVTNINPKINYPGWDAGKEIGKSTLFNLVNDIKNSEFNDNKKPPSFN